MRFCPVILLLICLPAVAAGQDDDWDDDEWGDEEDSGIEWSGFVEGAFGSRWDTDPQLGHRHSLGEARFRLETEWEGKSITIRFKGDGWYDTYLDEFDGEIRDVTLALSPFSNVDLRIGRQVLTWGTGDLLFLNDLFPKGWVSFFAGRDTEYLKAPSNAIRATIYTETFNLDLVWTPVFTPDEYLTGERFSFFSPIAGDRVAPSPPLHGIVPDKQIENGEIALRLFKTVGGIEYAAYAYRGYFHQPTALTGAFQATFAPLSAIGGSLRRSLASGLFNAEAAYYVSREDRRGADPLVPNDQFRFVLGYEREAITNLTVAFQYYLEWTQDYDQLVANSLAPEFEPDEYRQVLTNRLTYRLLQDKLTLSLFTFYSPSDSDYYARPSATFRYSDEWAFSGGFNLFGGSKPQTFFNQFADNSNVYVRFRYSY